MSDEDLREWKRRWQATGDADAGERYLRARLRAGTLGKDAVRIAADLGEPAAARLDPGEWPQSSKRESEHLPAWASVHWGWEALIEAAVAVAGLAPTTSPRRLSMIPSLDMPGWVRIQAQATWDADHEAPPPPRAYVGPGYGAQARWGAGGGLGDLVRPQAIGLLDCTLRIAQEHAEADPRLVARDALVPWLLGERGATATRPPRYALAASLARWSSLEHRVMHQLSLGIPALLPFPEPGERTCLGRTLPEADFTLHSPGVSRSQCWLDCDADGQVWIEDAGSSAGTYVNNQRVGRHRAQVGDTLRLGGGYGFLYRVIEARP